MRKFFPALLVCLGASGAFAQNSSGGVTVSNDPAKVAAVEKHAQELKAQQQANAAAKPAAKATRTGTAPKAKSKAKKTGVKPSATK